MDIRKTGSISKTLGEICWKQEKKIRQKGNMYDELYLAKVEAQLTLLTS